MATILNERDKALQAATYRSKLTAVSITSTSGGFKTAKNGGSTLAVGTSATSITLTAAPNSVYTIAATYTWHYAVSSAPTTWLSLGITGTTATITNTAFLTALGTSSQIQYRCTVTEPLLDTAYGYYTVLYTLEPSETISVALTRTNAVLTAASDGSITSLSTNGIYNNTGTTITVTRGTTSLNYSATAAANTFSVAIDTTQAAGRAINTVYSSNTSTSWSFDGITGLSIDGAKVAFIITVYDASGVAVSPTIGREIVYGKVSNGVIGSSARAVNLTTTTQVFNYNSAGSTPSPSSTVVTATAQNIPTGTAVYYEFLVGTTSKQNTTTNTYTYTPTTAFSSMPEQITVKIRETSNSSPVLASDTMSMIGLKAPVDGTNAITAILSNEVQVLPASLSGAVSSYTGSGTEIRVYEGATELTYDGVGTANSTWKFTTTPTNITVGTTTDSGTFATVGVHSGVADATDLSSIVYTITGKNSAGTSFTITKNQNFSKAKKGDTGNNAVVYDIITSAPVITKASPDAATAGAYASITIQGKKYDGNTASNYGWVTVTANGDTEIATATDTSSTTVSLAPATTAGKTYYTIKLYNQAAVTGATLLDTQIVYVVFTGGNGTNGTNAITAILSNEVQVLPASLSGAVSSYTGSGTEIRVYEGATELTYDGVGTANSTWKFTTTPTNITVGTTTDSGTFATVGVHSGVADATDLSSIVYTITGKNSAGTSFTITKNQNFSKAKKGDTGNNAVVYDIITSAPVITKASPDAATAGAYASITIQGKKYDGNTASNYGWVTVTANGDTEIATATDTSSTTVSLAPATTAGKTYYTIKLYNQAAVTGATLLDTQIVYVVFTGGNGTNAITGVLTNEVATVLADQSGNVDTYTGTGGTFFVYDGITDKTTSGSVTYSVAASSGLTISINSSGVYSITAITADLATATLRAVYGGVTIDKIYSVSKSKASATSPSIYPVLNYDFAGITLPTGAGVTSGITLSNSDNSTTTTMTTTAVDQYLTFSGLSLVPANSNVVSMRIKLISGTWEGKLYYDNVSHDITESYYKRIPKPAVGVWTTINLDLRTVEVYQTNGDTDYMTGGTVSALRFDFVSDTNAVVAIDYISVGKYGVAEATKSTTVYAYAWSTSTSAPARSGTGITGTTGLYTWSTGLVDNRPTGWTSYAPAAPGVGYTLYQLSLPIVDLATKLSTTVDWSTSAAVANTIGYKVDGSIGPRGQSYRTCYIVTTSGTAPATPTAAVGDAAPTGWSFQSTSTLTAGQYMYQSDGILTGMPDDLTSAASISWGPPYLSNLKVGTLQAISASLGTVQIASAGSLYSGKTSSTDVTHAGFFLGNESGTPKFNIGNADNSAGILWDGNNLTVKGSGTFSGSLNAADGTFSGALTADAINAVNTINLAGQSVTIPASSYTDGSIITGFLYTYTPRYNVLQSISSVSSGAPVQVFYSGAHSYYSNGNASAQLRATLGLDRVQGGVTTNLRTFTNIYTDSGMLSGVAAAKDNFCCIITDTPDAGEVTYNFWCNTTGYYIYVVSASSRCLLTLETKR